MKSGPRVGKSCNAPDKAEQGPIKIIILVKDKETIRSVMGPCVLHDVAQPLNN